MFHVRVFSVKKSNQKAKHMVSLKCSRFLKTKHMKVHLEARRAFWSNVKRGRFRGIRVMADAFEKGNARSIYGHIEAMTSLEYFGVAKPPMFFVMMMKDWHIKVERAIHIAMTAQEKPVEKTAPAPENLGFIYIGVAALRNHSGGLMKKLPQFLVRTRCVKMYDNRTDVNSLVKMEVLTCLTTAILNLQCFVVIF